MSLVVAYQEDGRVWMGSDSQATSEDNHIRYICHSKMFKIDKRFLVGYIGSVRQAQVVARIDYSECKNVFDVVEAMRLVLKESGCIGTTNVSDHEGEFEIMQSMFLIAHDGDLYEVGPDFAILDRVEPYGAIGAAKEYALSTFYTLDQIKRGISFTYTPKDRLKLALKVGSRFCATVGGKFFFEVL